MTKPVQKPDVIESWTNGWNMPTTTPFTGLVGDVAYKMLRECVRDGWIMGEHPVRFLRGNDHE
jgi:hypothetical protein